MKKFKTKRNYLVNNNIYIKYKELVDQEKNVIFGGRLATYKYYDMKDIFEEVFKHFDIKF